MMPYESSNAWRACDRLAHAIYRATGNWPRCELYGLTSQIRKAAVSAACNLVEGRAKRGSREYARFVDISFGSLAEVHYLLSFARAEELISRADFQDLEGLHADAGRQTWRLLAALRAKA